MYVQNGLSLAQTNARFSFCLSFLAAYDSLAEKACKQIVALVHVPCLSAIGLSFLSIFMEIEEFCRTF